MGYREIIHAILKVAKIAEEVFAHLANYLYFWRRRDGWTVGVVVLHVQTRWRRVTDYEARDHDEEEDAGHREHSEKVGV